MTRLPPASGSSPSSAASSVDLPLPFGPRDRHAFAPADVEIDRPEPEAGGLVLDDRARERGDDVAGAFPGLEAEVELPRLERLVGRVHAPERLLGLAHLRHQRVRPAAVLPAGLVSERRTARASLVPAPGKQRRNLAPALLALLELPVGPRARFVPGRHVLAPPARPLA